MNVGARVRTFQQGQDISIPCRVRGFPEPSVLWSKEGMSLIRSKRVNVLPDKTLLINRAHSTDHGLYECVAWNSAGQTRSSVRLTFTGERLLLLQKDYKASIIIYLMSERIVGIIG